MMGSGPGISSGGIMASHHPPRAERVPALGGMQERDERKANAPTPWIEPDARSVVASAGLLVQLVHKPESRSHQARPLAGIDRGEADPPQLDRDAR